MKNEIKIPTLAELVEESPTSEKENALLVLLNQNPPEKWIENHPMAGIPYLPINRVEYLLSKIYGKWSVDIKAVQILANSIVVTVRVNVKNPITGKWEYQDGVGASPIQTDKGAGAMDWNKAKANGVQMSAPSAETYAIKDACEKFGKIFGRDLGRKNSMDYTALLKVKEEQPNIEDLELLFEMKKEVLTLDEQKFAIRIIENKEVKSFANLRKLLMQK